MLELVLISYDNEAYIIKPTTKSWVSVEDMRSAAISILKSELRMREAIIVTSESDFVELIVNPPSSN